MKAGWGDVLLLRGRLLDGVESGEAGHGCYACCVWVCGWGRARRENGSKALQKHEARNEHQDGLNVCWEREARRSQG